MHLWWRLKKRKKYHIPPLVKIDSQSPIGRHGHVLSSDGGPEWSGWTSRFLNAVWVNVFITAGGRLGPDSLCSHTDKVRERRAKISKDRQRQWQMRSRPSFISFQNRHEENNLNITPEQIYCGQTEKWPIFYNFHSALPIPVICAFFGLFCQQDVNFMRGPCQFSHYKLNNCVTKIKIWIWPEMELQAPQS